MNIDLHRQMLQWIKNGDRDSALAKIRELFESPDDRLRMFKHLPGILLDAYCLTRLSTRTCVHELVYGGYVSCVALLTVPKRIDASGHRAVVRLLLTILECSPKVHRESGRCCSSHHIESMVMTFATSGRDHAERPFESDFPNLKSEYDYADIRKLRLLDDALRRRAPECVDLACDMASTFKAGPRAVLYGLLARHTSAAGCAYASTSISMLRSKKFPNYQDLSTPGAKRTNPSPGKQQLVRRAVEMLLLLPMPSAASSSASSPSCDRTVRRIDRLLVAAVGSSSLKQQKQQQQQQQPSLTKKEALEKAKSAAADERMAYLFEPIAVGGGGGRRAHEDPKSA
jgi:hypothetical protein